MPRYEYADGKSNKFWEITVKGASFTTTYGRIGTDGQSKTKDFADAAKAKAAAEKLTAQKVKKGYALTKGKKKKAPAKAKAKAPAKGKAKAPAKGKAKAPAKGKAKAPAKAKAKGKAKAKQTDGYRFELVSGNSAKFWEIVLDGAMFTTTYGRIGTDGKSTTKDFADAIAAKKKHDALIEEKVSKGYELVAGDLPKALTVKSAQNKTMEAAILKDPNDDAAWAVYADWLQAQGDPRGELAAVQMSLATAKGATKTKLKRSETKLFKDYGEYFAPPIIDMLAANHEARKPPTKEKWRYQRWQKEDKLAVTWSNGFIGTLDLRKDYEEKTSMEDILTEILSHPSGRFLRELVIGPLNIADTYSYSSIVKLLSKSKLGALRSLHLADFHSGHCENSWSDFGNLAGLWKAAPNLEHFRFHGAQFELGKIALPKARSFIVETGGLSAKSVKSIVGAKWPNLNKLEIWFGSSSYGAGGTAKMVQPLFEGKNIPKVVHLGLRNCEFTDDLCKLLVKSKIAKNLERLDLSKGTLSDVGAEALASKANAFPMLEELDVSRSYLSKEGIALLKKKVCKKIVDNFQQEPDDWGDGEMHRYVALGE